MESYDPRYLAGILFFNERAFFEAHEVWEDVWSESQGEDRRFYQGLIQAAVALYHFSNGNHGGALKLFRSGQEYMKSCGSPFHGMDTAAFWRQMAECFRGLLPPEAPDRSLRPELELAPTLTLDPPPQSWPDPDAYLRED